MKMPQIPKNVAHLYVSSYKEPLGIKHFRSFIRLSLCVFRIKQLKVKITKSEKRISQLPKLQRGQRNRNNTK